MRDFRLFLGKGLMVNEICFNFNDAQQGAKAVLFLGPEVIFAEKVIRIPDFIQLFFLVCIKDA